jgi:hypothetical protein
MGSPTLLAECPLLEQKARLKGADISGALFLPAANVS